MAVGSVSLVHQQLEAQGLRSFSGLVGSSSKETNNFTHMSIPNICSQHNGVPQPFLSLGIGQTTPGCFFFHPVNLC